MSDVMDAESQMCSKCKALYRGQPGCDVQSVGPSTSADQPPDCDDKATGPNTSADDAYWEDAFSMSESGDSVAGPSGLKAWRKRDRSELDSDDVSSDNQTDAPGITATVTSAKRGRGRPPTTGEYIGLHAAKKLLREKMAEEERKMERERREREVEAALGKFSAAGRAPRPTPSVPVPAEDCSATDLGTRVDDALALIKNVARVSKGLKGTSQKSLKMAVEAIVEAKEAWITRTASDENNRLQRERARISAELEDLRRENRELREDVSKLKAELRRPTPERMNKDGSRPQSVEIQELVEQMADMSTRFTALEDRLLRPPLRGDRLARGAHSVQSEESAQPAATYAEKTTGRAAKTPKAAPPPPERTAPPPVADATDFPPLSKGKGKKTKKAEKKIPPPAASAPAAPAPAASGSRAAGGEWQTAGAKKAAKKAQKAQKAKERAKKRALRPPRSSAVVLTLQPAAVEKGLKYVDVLQKTKGRVILEQLGIPTGVRLKTTRTGARLLEVPGANSGDKADALAKKLGEVLSTEEVRVSRPTKTVNLKITGLDDSAMPGEVAAVVSRAGGCSLSEVRCGTIRTGRNGGLGTAIVACPVAAAKKVVEARRILFGCF